MDWYYANGGEKQGPVDQAAFDRLAAEGVILETTLVWHEGLTEWQRYSDTEPAMYCTECGKPHPIGFMMPFGRSWICVNCKPRFAQKIREGVLHTLALPYAGFWIRFAAKSLDGIVLWIVNMLPNFFLAGMIGFRAQKFDPTHLFAYFGTLSLFQLAFSVAYETLFVWKYGGTPGKLVLGLKIVRPDGTALSLPLALGRYAANFVTGFTMGIGHVMAAFDDEKRALHDRLAGTRVIKPE